jgi:hypothetical protein
MHAAAARMFLFLDQARDACSCSWIKRERPATKGGEGIPSTILTSACMADLRDTQRRPLLASTTTRAPPAVPVPVPVPQERGRVRAGGDRTASRRCVGVNEPRFTRFPFCVHGYMSTIYPTELGIVPVRCYGQG